MEHEDEFWRSLAALRPRLKLFAYKLTKNATEAEDLVSLAMLRAFSARSSFQAGSNLTAWVVTILRNSFLSQKRRKTEESWDDERELSHPIAAGQEVTAELADTLTAIRELPRDFQVVLLLLAGGLQYADIAQKLGLAVGTIKSRAHRARQALAEHVPDLSRRVNISDAYAEMMHEFDRVLQEIEHFQSVTA